MKNWRQFGKLYILSFLKYPASRLRLEHKRAQRSPEREIEGRSRETRK